VDIENVIFQRGSNFSVSKFLSNLIQADIIEPVSGYGKGKYKFKKV